MCFAKVVGLLFMDELNLYLQSCRLKGVGGILRQREVRKIPRVVQTFFEHYNEAFFKLSFWLIALDLHCQRHPNAICSHSAHHRSTPYARAHTQSIRKVTLALGSFSSTELSIICLRHGLRDETEFGYSHIASKLTREYI